MAYVTVNTLPFTGEEEMRTEIENARLNDAELINEVTTGRIGAISLAAKNTAQDASITANTAELEAAKGSEVSVDIRLGEIEADVASAETQIDINTATIAGLSAQTGAKVSATDTTVGFLEDKIVAKAGSGIILTKINTGGNEQLEIDTPAVPTSELGSATVTLAAGASHTLTLASPMDALGKAHTTVTKEVPQTNITNNKWSIETNDTMWDQVDSAYSTTLTLGALTGDTTATLSTGVWSAGDVSKSVTDGVGHAIVSGIYESIYTEYPPENANGSTALNNDNSDFSGECISISETVTVKSLRFLVDKLGTPNGGVKAQIRTTTGTVGTTAVGTATILHETPTLISSEISTTESMREFIFSSPVTLTAGDYCIGLANDNITTTGSNYARIYRHTAGTYSNGNLAYIQSDDTWSAVASYDTIFQVIAVDESKANAKILTDFTSTVITSGNWKLSKGMFVDGSFSLSGFEEADWSAWDGTVDGVAAVFESAATTYISSVALDNTRVLVCYQDGGNSNYGTAIVLTVNTDNTISSGTPVIFEDNGTTLYISVCKVDSDKAVVCYQDGVGSNYGSACVLSITGTIITVGAQAVFESANTAYISVCKIDTNKALVCYADGGNTNINTACVLSVSGTTITPGTPVASTHTNSTYISVAQLDTDKVIVCYYTNVLLGSTRVVSVSGTVPSYGAAAQFEAATVSYVSVAALSSTKAVVAYRDEGNANYGTACVLEVSGTTVTPGTPIVFTSQTVSYCSLTKIADTHAHLCYSEDTGGAEGSARVLTVNGSVLTIGQIVSINEGSTSHISNTRLSEGTVVVSYQDASNSSHGTAKVLNGTSTNYIDNEPVSAVTNSSGQVDSTYFTDLNSLTPSDTLNGQSAYYGVTTDTLVYQVVGNGESTLRNVVKFDTVWQYNSNVTYGSETWTAATIDTVHGAIEQAIGITANCMSSATAAAVPDVTWPAFGSTFGVFMAVKTTDSTVTPTIQKIDFNYDGQLKNVYKTHEYTVENPDVNTIKVTSNDASSTNIRIYTSI